MDQATTFDQRRPMEEVVGGSIVEGVGGAAIVLAILGLIGILPAALAAIAVIAIGLSLLVGGGTAATHYARLVTGSQPRYGVQLVGGGITMEALAGLATVVLGILALFHLQEVTLLAAAVLIFGCALLMASAAIAHMDALHSRFQTAQPDRTNELVRESVYMTGGSQGLIGAAAVVLGILALGGFDSLTLVLVGILCVGASVLQSGMSTAIGLVGAPNRA